MTMDSIEKLNTAIAIVEEARGVPLSASCVVHRGEMLEILEGMLKAAGYVFSGNLDILDDDFESGEELILKYE